MLGARQSSLPSFDLIALHRRAYFPPLHIKFGFHHHQCVAPRHIATRSSAIKLCLTDVSRLSSVDHIFKVLESSSLPDMLRTAEKLRDEGFPHGIVTFSPKVFIPLTRLCRDSCGYCTFTLPPIPGRRAYMTIDEVVTVARLGAEQGCTEALFTLGKKPT